MNKIEFNKHKGYYDKVNNHIVFYNLVFNDIFHAGNFLKNIEPGNYTGWVNDGKFGLINLDTNEKITYLDNKSSK